MRRNPKFGETSTGAVAGAVVASIGGLFALGIAPAVLWRNATMLFTAPMLSLVSWILSLPVGWLLGGQIGPRLGFALRSSWAEVIGGVFGGLIPVIAIALFGWYIAVSH